MGYSVAVEALVFLEFGVIQTAVAYVLTSVPNRRKLALALIFRCTVLLPYSPFCFTDDRTGTE